MSQPQNLFVCGDMLLGGYSQVSWNAADKIIDGDDSGETYERLIKVICEYLKVEEVAIQKVERQIVSGTNWRVTVTCDGGGTYQCVVWQQLPAYGGSFSLTSCEKLPCNVSAEEHQVPHGERGDAEGLEDPELDAAVSFALQALSEQSNSLAPFQLKKLVKASKGVGGVHEIVMVVGQGCMAEHTVEVVVTASDHGFVLSRVSYL